MFSKLKQYKDLRDQAKQVQNVLGQEIVEASALSGKLKMTMDGNQKVKKVEINPELLTPNNKEKLETGIQDLVDNSINAVQKRMAAKMRSGDLQMPDMSNLGM